jgi:hypothetical protein
MINSLDGIDIKINIIKPRYTRLCFDIEFGFEFYFVQDKSQKMEIELMRINGNAKYRKPVIL